MSVGDLNSWLMNEGIREDVSTLVRIMVRSELDNLVSDIPSESVSFDWPRLLLAGSFLARSEFRAHQETALRIATGAVTLGDSASVNDAGAVLLDMLSNSRAIQLAHAKEYLASGLEKRLGMTLRMEMQHRQMTHSVLVQSSGRWLAVNEFQQRFWDNANKHIWLSASAPTASGKTYMVLQWLTDHMRTAQSSISVYLAPTRALVSEIESELALLLGKNSGIEVSSLPLREKYNTALAGMTKLILVYTQERLHLLLNSVGSDLSVDFLIVDEAHKIGDSQRGIILQDAIERLERTNPALKIIFISPATQNPEELLADAPSGTQSAAVDSDQPTVLQNIIIADQAPRKPKLWNLTVRHNDSLLPIGMLQLASSPGSIKKKLAFIAAAIGERGGTLVYANGAAEAEDIADLISQLIPPPDYLDRELSDLADLSRKGVHPSFMLASLVERGVAYHYGNMPSLIRLEVERLFRSGKIRFLVCTSTLIEGVNLSCRTIVVRGPRKGRGHPMEPHDFWNLAGRAGRWGNEFQGNIVCIDSKDTAAWPSGVPARSRYPIKRESDAVLETGDGMADYLALRASTPLTELKGAEEFEQVGAYFLATYLRLGTVTHANFAKRHSPLKIAKLEESLAALAKQVELDHKIADRHPGVSALGLQKLLDAFRAYEGDPENLLPAHVDSEDSFDRFVTIMRRINENLFPAFVPDELIKLYALTVVQWLKGYSLAKMIRDSIEWHKTNGRAYKLPLLIRQTMERVEQIARFRAPKYFSAYMDILNIHLNEIGKKDIVDDEIDIGTQLEFGVSTRTLLSLMELGLSRMSAVSLYEKIARDDLTEEDCRDWVSARSGQLETLDIPAIIIREIREKLLTGDDDIKAIVNE